jgi:hypothetical protein
MAALAHGWKPKKGSKIGRIPLKVAKEFNQADKGTGIRKISRQRRSFGKTPAAQEL